MNEDEIILYHYTSLEGLLGIIDTKSIWATNILYLNDASELNYSRTLFKDQLRTYQEEIIKDAHCYEYKVFADLIRNIEDEDFIHPELSGGYVCSFSEEEDLLSQWRGYCPKGLGLSLGFNFKKLHEYLVGDKNIFIRSCIYDEKEQIKQLRELIEQFEIRYKNDLMEGFEYIFTEFMNLAPTFKHPKFKEEREWRLFYVPSYGLVESKGEFRLGHMMAIPYIEIPLPKEGNKLIINKVVVGPTTEPKLSKTSLKMLLKQKRVEFEEVRYSTIPYRNW
jgi:hypothetical protein